MRISSSFFFLVIAVQLASLTLYERADGGDYRSKRAVRERTNIQYGPPIAPPSLLARTLMDAQETVFSGLIRNFVSFERFWYDLTAEIHPAGALAILILGAILTFIAIFIPLKWLFGAPSIPLLPLSGLRFPGKRNLPDQDTEDEVTFPLDSWEDQMESWIRDNRNQTGRVHSRYRCCLFPYTSQDAEETGFARCHPLVAQRIYPWNNPCPAGSPFKDVSSALT